MPLKLQRFLKGKRFCVISMSLLSFRITLPHPVPRFSCVKVTVLLRKCQTGALSPLSGHHGCQVAVVSNKPFTVSAASSSHARTTSLGAAAERNLSDIFSVFIFCFCIDTYCSLCPPLSLPLAHNANQFTTAGTKGASAYKSPNYPSS